MDDTHDWRSRLDGPMLVSLLASGILWLLLLAPPWTDARGLFLIGGAYVVLGSVTSAAVYAGESTRPAHEAANLVGQWLVAVLIWAVLMFGFSSAPVFTPGDVGGSVSIGLIIATPAFVLWQVLGLVLRGCRWRTRRPLGADDWADDWADHHA